MNIKSMILSLTLPILCAACTDFPYLTDPAPPIKLDPVKFSPAQPTPTEPPHEVVVEKPVIVPMKGQLKPPPSSGSAASSSNDGKTPEEVVKAAAAAATRQPNAKDWLNAIQDYTFDDGALYQVYAKEGLVTDVMLQQGETLVSISAGDTERFIIGDTSSGAGKEKRVHILIKPRRSDIDTNMIINTDKRTYHLDVHSTGNTYMAAVKWSYPDDDLILAKAMVANDNAQAATTIATGFSVDDIKFRYSIKGKNVSWKPVRVFDDTNKVYIQFPDRIDQTEIPPLFVISEKGEPQLVNYRKKGPYYIVDRMFGAAELRLGTDPQQVVRIERTDIRTEE